MYVYLSLSTYIYIYIYIYTHTHRAECPGQQGGGASARGPGSARGQDYGQWAAATLQAAQKSDLIIIFIE